MTHVLFPIQKSSLISGYLLPFNLLHARIDAIYSHHFRASP
jgi:hypothetical protein